MNDIALVEINGCLSADYAGLICTEHTAHFVEINTILGVQATVSAGPKLEHVGFGGV